MKGIDKYQNWQSIQPAWSQINPMHTCEGFTRLWMFLWLIFIILIFLFSDCEYWNWNSRIYYEKKTLKNRNAIADVEDFKKLIPLQHQDKNNFLYVLLKDKTNPMSSYHCEAFHAGHHLSAGQWKHLHGLAID